MQKIWGTSGPNLERSKIQPLQWSYCKHFWAHRDQIWSALRFHIYKGHIAKDLGHIGTKIWSALEFHLYKGYIAKNLGHIGTKFGAL